MVLGAIQRGGESASRGAKERRPPRKLFIISSLETTAANTKRLITDEAPGYHGIADADTTHETVNHQRGGMGTR